METKWWQKSIVYQIYPRSFYDSNGDGIGDLNGIIEKLDYIRSLGVNMIWLCPIYRSPMVDNGYDISDYRHIDPSFGTDEEIEKLIREADKRGIGVLMDLVVNHTSDRHPWFQEALRDPKGEYADYYLFRETKNGKPPNNLRSYFGEPVWSRVPGTDRWYFHTYAAGQPDLNWDNPKVRGEIGRVVEWWLGKGAKGFRIDAIGNIKKSPEALSCRTFEADGPDGMAFVAPWVDIQPGVEDFLHELSDRVFCPSDCMTVAEVSVPKEKLARFIGPEGCFCMTFDFDYANLDERSVPAFEKPDFTVKEIRDLLFKDELDEQAAGGWSAPYFENHDQPRSLNKWVPEEDSGPTSAKMLATLLICLRGTPFLYQGEELGMTNCPMALDDFRDISARTQFRRGKEMGYSDEWMLEYLNRRCRDNSRTPFQWNREKNAGFTAGEPWLKVNPNYLEINAASEGRDPYSVLNYYRELIRLRTRSQISDILTYGAFEPVESDEDIVAYRRVFQGRTVLIVCHFGRGETFFRVSDAIVLLANAALRRAENGLIFGPYEAAVLLLQ